MREGRFRGLNPKGFHTIIYSDWGDIKNPDVVICVHGLTRNRHSFNWLAPALAEDYRVICPDIVGRGDSDFLQDISRYNYAQYLSDMAVLLAHLGVEQVDWVGTSMGGIMGMMLASFPNTPIRRLVLNDIGHRVPLAGMQRIVRDTADPPYSAIREEVCADVRRIFEPEFGPLSEAIWQDILSASIRWDASSREFSRAYDPVIVEDLVKVVANASESQEQGWDLSSYWHKVQCPTLILRGCESDILTEDIAKDMMKDKSNAKLVEIKGYGHAIPLIPRDQIQIVVNFLSKI